MKWSIIALLSVIFFSCSPKIVYVPVETNTQVRDSLVINYRDSIRVIPIERIVDIVAEYDTLYLETSLAKAIAYADSNTHTLRGEIQNKQEIVYKTVYKDRIEYKDSIQTKEIPVEIVVEKVKKVVPWWARILSIIGGISLAVAAGYAASKFI